MTKPVTIWLLSFNGQIYGKIFYTREEAFGFLDTHGCEREWIAIEMREVKRCSSTQQR